MLDQGTVVVTARSDPHLPRALSVARAGVRASPPGQLQQRSACRCRWSFSYACGLRRHLRGPRHAAGPARRRASGARRGRRGRARIQGAGRCGAPDAAAWSPPPAKLAESSARYDIALDAHESRILALTVHASAGEIADAPPDFDAALAAVEARRLDNSSADAHRDDRPTSVQSAGSTRSVADLQMMTTDTPHGPYPYAGVPWFSTPFGRDGIITALEMLWIEPGARARRARAIWPRRRRPRSIPEQDAEPGKILHETRGGEMAALGEVPFGRYYGSVDATPLFVDARRRVLRAHRRSCASSDELWPNIERALGWIDTLRRSRRRRLRRVSARSRANGLVQQGWKDSQRLGLPRRRHARASAPIALCEVQGYVYAALRRGRDAGARARAITDAGARARAQAEQLRERVRGGVLVRGARHLRARARRRQAALPRAHLERRALPVRRHRRRPSAPQRVAARLAGRRHRSPAGACARWRAARRATTRCRITTARSGRTTTRSSPRASPATASTDAVAAILTGLFEASLHRRSAPAAGAVLRLPPAARARARRSIRSPARRRRGPPASCSCCCRRAWGCRSTPRASRQHRPRTAARVPRPGHHPGTARPRRVGRSPVRASHLRRRRHRALAHRVDPGERHQVISPVSTISSRLR